MDDELDQDFWNNFLHTYQTEGVHEMDTPYGRAVPYYEHEGQYYPYGRGYPEPRSEWGADEHLSHRDHTFAYVSEHAYDPYTDLHHRAGPHDGDDTYLGVQRSHDHDLSMQHRLVEAHR